MTFDSHNADENQKMIVIEREIGDTTYRWEIPESYWRIRESLFQLLPTFQKRLEEFAVAPLDEHYRARKAQADFALELMKVIKKFFI